MAETQARPYVTVPTTRHRNRQRKREWSRPPKRDPHTRVIAQLLELAGPDSSVIATSSRPWASATFVGVRHKIILRISGTDHAEHADHFTEALPEAEFSISGHIVAETCVDARQSIDDNYEPPAAPTGDASKPMISGETILRLCILTIEDW